MNLKLSYGRHGLEVELPDSVTVIEPLFVPGLSDEEAAVRQALRYPIGTPPLAELVRPTDTVAIVFSDITRPVPNQRLLLPLLKELSAIPRDHILLINALGLHRANTKEELIGMLGEETVARYRIVQHNAEDKANTVYLGKSSFGAKIFLNRSYVEASVRILTGLIEPHFFAGFSGGAKSVLPGIAGAETVMHLHSAQMIGHPQATWGVTTGNPVYEEAREGVVKAPPHFLLNVATNKNKEITGVFAGDWQMAHEEGCAFVRHTSIRRVAKPFDIVITTNSGYPLDLNLYQAVKGMSAAAQVVREGGAIIVASQCVEGVGHGAFGQILRMRASPKDVLEMICAPSFSMPDQWEAQALAQLLLKARVYLYSEGLSDEDIAAAHLLPCHSVEEPLGKLLAELGPGATVCVLPQGPMTIPVVG